MSIRNESLWGNNFLRGKFKKKWEVWCISLNINKVEELLYTDQIITPFQFEKRFQLQPRGLIGNMDRP